VFANKAGCGMPESGSVIWLRREHAGTGRPAERSRGELTAAALAIADAEGLAAVSMRRVAASLGTGPASLYRYVTNRDDLLDLMADAVASEYGLPEPCGDWLADLIEVARQARSIMLRRTWVPDLIITGAAIGPHSVELLEYVLTVLKGHPAGAAAKLTAFAIMNAVTAAYVQHEISAGEPARQRQAAYLQHVATAGAHPHLAEALSALRHETGDQADQFGTMIGRVLSGLLPGAAP
jgi:AcrR family transcriptional regulator